MKGEFFESFTNHEANLFVTLQISKPVLDKAPLLEEILDLLAWSGNAFMGVSLMAAILDKKETELIHPLSLGTTLHLLHKEGGKERYDIHRLVRGVRKEQVPISDRGQWVEDVCLRLGKWFKERRQEFTDLPVFEAEIDHLKEWLEYVTPHSSVHAARLTWLQAYPPYHWGKYQEALQMLQKAFSIYDQTDESGPELKANILNDLGFTFRELGEINKAFENHKHALEIRLEVFGEEHPDIALSLNNIGATYLQLKRYNKALNSIEQAFEIRSKVIGEQHPDTADSLGGIVQCLLALKEHEQAKKRLNDYLEQLPEDHSQYQYLTSLKKHLPKEKPKSSIPSKKKRKKKRPF
ncbi:MAG: tetratricopeptide repeat protein [bacterium]|nr:tetratricopeptide repeat protein [bacterium]